MQHVATGCMGDVREYRKFGESGTGFVCKMCRGRRRKAADEFCFKDVEFECVGEFVYLGNMLNNTGGAEQAVAARVRAAWMKFRELGGNVMYTRVFFEDERCCV